MELKDRLSKFISSIGLSSRQLAITIGLKPQRIYDILSGKTNSLSYEVGHQIISKFPQLNEHWLRTGEGEMLRSGSITAGGDIVGGHKVEGNDNVVGENITTMPSDTKELKEKIAELEKQNKDLIAVIKKLTGA